MPKGVAVSHAGLLGGAAAQRAGVGLGADARVLMVAAPTFDASIGEMLLAAGSEATLVIAPPQIYAGQALTTLLQDQQVSAAILTPTVVSSLDRARLAGLDTLMVVRGGLPQGIGGRLGAGPADVQRLWPHRNHHLDHLCATVGGAANQHRRPDPGGGCAGARRAPEPGAGRGGW